MEKLKQAEQDLKQTEAVKKQAHKDFRAAKQEYKKAIKSAEKTFIAADRARAKAIADDRLARKALRAEQDRLKIEKSQKAVK